MRVALLHPELGFGGSERLMLDAGIELQARGHEVCLHTTEYVPERSFPEARELDIRVHPPLVPTHLAGRAQALCSIARMLSLARHVSQTPVDVTMCDLVAQAVPLLKRWTRAPAVFYCHFPDRFLTQSGEGLRRIYRSAVDHLELQSLRAADSVLTNSAFSREVIDRIGVTSEVLYPGIDPLRFSDLPFPLSDRVTILVVGRFDPRKNLGLAIDTLRELFRVYPELTGRVSVRIVGSTKSASGEGENIAQRLEKRIGELRLERSITLHRNPSEAELLAHFAWSTCLMHTALGEHFGLAPVEAMAASRPVLAVRDAGPLETVLDGETGWLCPPEPAAFAEVLRGLAEDPTRGRDMGHAGRARMLSRFSRSRFGAELEGTLERVVSTRRNRRSSAAARAP